MDDAVEGPLGMTVPAALVLIHGGQHDSRCWQPTIDAITRQAPGTRILAVNLPGRLGVPGDLDTLTIADCVEAAVGQIEQAGLQDIVLVGHSMAGLTVPGVATKLGADRVRRIICVACSVPPQGQRILDTLIPPIRLAVGRARNELPLWMAKRMFTNGMTPQQRAFSLSVLIPDASRLALETVDRSGLPDRIPRSWVLTRRDRALPPRQQRRFIDNLGGVQEVIELDTCHNAMISRPDELAAILVARL
jgi:pimeloyl-ACP methyl ester carboxylesterase